MSTSQWHLPFVEVAVAQAVEMGVELAVTLATTVTQLTGSLVPFARSILVLESDVDVYVVTLKGTADGGALPSTGRKKFATTALPIEVSLVGAGFVGLAGSSAGTCRVELRQ